VRLVATIADPRELSDVPAWADLAELRLDLLPTDGVASALRAGLPAIATVRSVAEGGAFAGTPEEAASLLLDAVRLGARWVDAERPVFALVLGEARRLGARVLASVHAPAPTLPADGADAWKVARPVEDAPAFAAVLAEAGALARRSALGDVPPATLLPYGALGGALRVVTSAAAEGAGVDSWVFAAPSEVARDDRAGAALRAQPSGARLLDELRLGEVSPRARLFGLLGRTLSRSPSPALHNAAFRSLGLDALYLPEIDLPPKEAFALPMAGWSVTAPWKEEAASLCARLDPLADAARAVNTVLRAPNGALHGWNTDASAVAAAIAEGGPRTGDAWILGGGGFARAAAVACLRAGLRVSLCGGERAARAARELGAAHVAPGTPPREASLVVNATPLGAAGEAAPALVDLARAVGRATLAIDAPYGPGRRPGAFAALAGGRGAVVVDGHRLLLLQAERQAAIFCGRPPAPGVLRTAWLAPQSLVLVGLRGAGKTAVGRAVARRLGRPFVDTDDEVARAAGRPAGRVLAEDGEEAFRSLERAAVRRAAARRGAVVATGGGAVESPEAVAAIAPHFVVHLAVGAPEAARRVSRDPTPRPRLAGARSAEEEGERLQAARGPAYARVARAVVATDGRSVEDVAAEVARLWTTG
jgi:shikimate 5-dehydrogenase/shikimate kinase